MATRAVAPNAAPSLHLDRPGAPETVLRAAPNPVTFLFLRAQHRGIVTPRSVGRSEQSALGGSHVVTSAPRRPSALGSGVYGRHCKKPTTTSRVARRGFEPLTSSLKGKRPRPLGDRAVKTSIIRSYAPAVPP